MSDVIRQETTVFFLAIALGAGLSPAISYGCCR